MAFYFIKVKNNCRKKELMAAVELYKIIRHFIETNSIAHTPEGVEVGVYNRRSEREQSQVYLNYAKPQGGKRS